MWSRRCGLGYPLASFKASWNLALVEPLRGSPEGLDYRPWVGSCQEKGSCHTPSSWLWADRKGLEPRLCHILFLLCWSPNIWEERVVLPQGRFLKSLRPRCGSFSTRIGLWSCQFAVCCLRKWWEQRGDPLTRTNLWVALDRNSFTRCDVCS